MPTPTTTDNNNRNNNTIFISDGYTAVDATFNEETRYLAVTIRDNTNTVTWTKGWTLPAVGVDNYFEVSVPLQREVMEVVEGFLSDEGATESEELAGEVVDDILGMYDSHYTR